MDLLIKGFVFLYVIIFFVSVFLTLKFELGSEGKDERGHAIAHKSYSIIFPLIPLGWLFIELFNDYIQPLNYEVYKIAIWFLLTGLMIIHAVSITFLKRKY